MQLRLIKQLNTSLSPLGFGVMRLPQNPDGSFPKAVRALLSEAYTRGINYFDTGFLYLGGHSEELIRDTLVSQFPRDTFYIADKLPVWLCENTDDMERIFQIQLERLGVDYIDFYLLHGVNRQTWAKAYENGALEFLAQKRAEGRIHNIGFSMHDNAQILKEILDANNWDFAQLQINYYDWAMQNVKENYDLLAERNIPCMVMEPIGGGRLAKLPEEAEQTLKDYAPDASIISWAIRYSASLPNVAVTLSGMNDLEQLKENLSYFEPIQPLSKQELIMLESVTNIIREKNAVPCTTCRYCLDECPANVDIPQIFQRWNNFKMFDKNNMERFDIDYFMFVPALRNAANCVACGKCAAHCPQHIDIPRELKIIHNTALALSIGIDIEKLRGKENVVLFGTGVDGRRTLNVLQTAGINVSWLCDNNPNLWNTTIAGVMVISPQTLKNIEATVIITSSKYHNAISAQLSDIGITAINA
jgi:predicted aldo/keto reductase-like oxidoreductase